MELHAKSPPTFTGLSFLVHAGTPALSLAPFCLSVGPSGFCAPLGVLTFPCSVECSATFWVGLPFPCFFGVAKCARHLLIYKFSENSPFFFPPPQVHLQCPSSFLYSSFCPSYQLFALPLRPRCEGFFTLFLFRFKTSPWLNYTPPKLSPNTPELSLLMEGPPPNFLHLPPLPPHVSTPRSSIFVHSLVNFTALLFPFLCNACPFPFLFLLVSFSLD